ncbi:MAG: hypothetical protein HY315_07240 [Acidobacteria bacterium]|nr:hypothetical protein [Acidobacteriota bacterium]
MFIWFFGEQPFAERHEMHVGGFDFLCALKFFCDDGRILALEFSHRLPGVSQLPLFRLEVSDVPGNLNQLRDFQPFLQDEINFSVWTSFQ